MTKAEGRTKPDREYFVIRHWCFLHRSCVVIYDNVLADRKDAIHSRRCEAFFELSVMVDSLLLRSDWLWRCVPSNRWRLAGWR